MKTYNYMLFLKTQRFSDYLYGVTREVKWLLLNSFNYLYMIWGMTTDLTTKRENENENRSSDR
jgi:hypothetical protein